MEKGIVVSLIFALIVGVFALKNGAPVVIDFIFTEIELSQSIVIFISALAGALIIFLVSAYKAIKRNSEIRSLSKELGLLKEENEALKEELGEVKKAKENALEGLADLSSEEQ